MAEDEQSIVYRRTTGGQFITGSGENDNGEVGYEGVSQECRGPSPHSRTYDGDVDMVSASTGRSLLITRTVPPQIWGWGDQPTGQFGQGVGNIQPYGLKTAADAGFTMASMKPTPIDDSRGHVIVVNNQELASFTMHQDGTMFGWGSEKFREQGHRTYIVGDTLNLPPLEFQSTDNLPIWSESGNLHQCVLFSNWRMRCWGYNLEGQLGNQEKSLGAGPYDNLGTYDPSAPQAGGEYLSRIPFVDMEDPVASRDIVNIAVASASTCVLFRGGKAKCFGANVGNLGMDPHIVQSVGAIPGTIFLAPDMGFTSTEPIVEIVAGGATNCFIFANFEARCLGEIAGAGYGDVDDEAIGNDIDYTLWDPVSTPPLAMSVVALALGRYFGCAWVNETVSILPKDLVYKCWGYENNAELFPGPASPACTGGWGLYLKYNHTNPHIGVMPLDFEEPALFRVLPARTISTGNTVMMIVGPGTILNLVSHALLDDGGGNTANVALSLVTTTRFDGILPVWPVTPVNVSVALVLNDGTVIPTKLDIEIIPMPVYSGTTTPHLVPLRGTELPLTVHGTGFDESQRPLRCMFNSTGSVSAMTLRATDFTCIEVPPAANPTVPYYETIRLPISAQITVGRLKPVYEDFSTFSYYNDRVTAVVPNVVPYDGMGIQLTLYGAELLDTPTDIRMRFSVTGTSIFATKFGSMLQMSPFPVAVCEAPDLSGEGGFSLPHSVVVAVSFNGFDFSEDVSTITVFKQPTLTGISPPNVVADPSLTTFPSTQELSITGGNLFQSGLTVVRYTRAGNLSDVIADVAGTVTSGIQLKAQSLPFSMVPAGQDIVWLTVSLDNGTTFSADHLELPYVSLQSVSPNLGTVAGGVPVTMRGDNFRFTGTEECEFDGLAVPASFISTTSIACETPAAPGGPAGGEVQVAVSNSGGRFTVDDVRFTYYPDPLFAGTAVPKAVPGTPYTGLHGPLSITIAGAAFPAVDVSNVTCRFGPFPAAATSASATGVVCDAPTGTGILPVLISWNAGVTFHLSGASVSLFEVLLAFPSIVPQSGSVGTLLRIEGDGLVAGPGLACRFFEAPAGAFNATSPATFQSSQEVTCAIPAGMTMSCFVEVTFDGFGVTFDRVQAVVLPSTPTLVSTEPVAAPAIGGGNLVITGSSFPALIADGGPAQLADVRCRIGFAVIGATSVTAPTQVVCPLPPGGGLVSVEVSFNGGATYSNGLPFSYFSITGLSPSSGHASGGLTVTVAGTDLTASPLARCAFGTLPPVPATVHSAVRLTCVTPPNAVGAATVPISVTLNDLSPANGTLWSVPSVSTQFDFFDTPEVISLSPRTGPAATGNLTVTGSAFAIRAGEVALCFFDNQEVVATLVVPPSTIVCPVPDGLGAVGIEISINSGSDRTVTLPAPRKFQFFTVLDVSPRLGPTTGGTTVTVLGTGFTLIEGASAVLCRFGAASTVTATVDGTFQIRCVTPPSAPSTVPVEFSADNGLLFSEYGAANFTYYTAASITSVVPSVGPSSGIAFTIKAAALTDSGSGVLCRIGLDVFPAVSVNYVLNEIVCNAQPGSGTAIPVDISQNGGADFTSSGLSFSYYGINSLSPNLGPIDGSLAVAVSGFGLTSVGGAAVCRFGALDVPADVRSTLSVICPKPSGTHPAGPVPLEFSPDGIGFTTDARPFAFYPTPSLTYLTPSVGPSLGTVVTVVGNALAEYPPAPIRCRFGVSETTGTAVPGGNITCPAPQGSGSVALEVSLNGGRSYTSDGLQFAFYNLLKIAPDSGPVLGGSSVTVTGTGFVNRPTLACRFGTIPAAAGFVSAAQVTCQSPPHVQGALNVEVSIDGTFFSTEAMPFTYFETPRVTAMSPSTGPTAGVLVTIYGAFNATGRTTRCRFGLRQIVPEEGSLVVVPGNYSSIVCRAPPGSSTVNVELSLNGGADYTDDQFNFGYYSVRSLKPSSGPSSGDTEVIISGSGFQPSATAVCRFSAQIVPATVLSAAQVRCFSPSLLPGAYDVQYSSDGAVYTSPSLLTYTAYITPTIARVEPEHVRAEGGTPVTVFGSGFLNDTLTRARCRFGISEVPAISVSANGRGSLVLDEMVCLAPSSSGAATVDVSFNEGGHYSYSRVLVTHYRLTSVFPAIGPTTGGTAVEFLGEGFTVAAELRSTLWCKFGDTITKNAKRQNDDSTLTCIVPPASAGPGPVPVRVSANGRDFSNPVVNYTYISPPFSSGWSPKTVPAGDASGKTRITVSGANFPSAPELAPLLTSRCSFTGIDVDDIVIVSSSSLHCPAPRGIGTNDLTVTFNDGEDILGVGLIRYFAATSASPRIAPRRGGTSVVVAGNGFSTDDGAGAILCRYGGSAVVPGEVLSDVAIRCDPAPPLAAGVMTPTMALEVTTNGVTYTDPIPFDYVAEPLATAVTPQEGPTAGGANITLYGTDFNTEDGLECRFGLASEAQPVPAKAVLDPATGAVIGAECSTTVHVIATVQIFVSVNGQQFLGTGLNHTYVPCPPGYYALVHTIPCQPCAPGTFAAEAGTKKCASCESDEYAENEGSTSCDKCPENTFIPIKDRVNRTFCECEPGFFSNVFLSSSASSTSESESESESDGGGSGSSSGNNGTTTGALSSSNATATTRALVAGRRGNGYHDEPTVSIRQVATTTTANSASNGTGAAVVVSGKACEICPVGATCAGATSMPVPSPGYWATKDSPLLMMKCDVPEACVGGDTETCALGYGGRLCAGCLPGNYVLNGRCTACPPKARWRVLLFCLFCIVLCFVLIKIVGKNASASGGTIGIATFFFQVLAMLAKLQLNWPYAFRVTLEIVTMPFTLNLDLLASECVFPTTYKAKWLGMFFMPWIFLGLFTSIYLLGLLLLFGRCCMREKGADLDVESTHIIGGAGALKQIKDPPLAEVDIRNRVISAYFLFVTLVYLLPTTLSFEIFDCTIREDGEWTLDASPNLLCYEPWWYEVSPFGAMGILFYAILLPASIGAFIFYNRAKLDTPYFISRYGSMFTDFKPTVPFWEAILMWQKVLMLLPIMYFTTFPEFQIAMFMLVLFLTLTVNLIVRPFFLERYNRLQTVLRWCACLMLLLGMSIRVSSQFSDKVAARLKETGGSKGSYVVANQQILVLSICFMMLGVGVLFILAAIAFDVTVIHWEMRRRIAPTILRNIDRLCHPHGKTIIIQWLGKGNSGQDFEDPLGIVLHSIAAEKVHRKINPDKPPELTPIDKFIDLYSGVVFTTPVLPVVRQWVLSRIERSPTDPRALQELTLFGETFAQFNRFKVKLTSSREIFPTLEHGISRVGAERYALCVRDPDLYAQVLEGEDVLRHLFFADIVSDTTIKAVFKQVHREVTLSLKTLQDASITMTALDSDDPTMARSGLSLDTEVVRARMRNQTLSAESAALIADASHLLVPYLATMYEGSLKRHAIDNLVGMMRVSLNPRKTMLSKLSPFVYLHRLFVGTRDERDEESVPYEYVDVVEGYAKGTGSGFGNGGGNGGGNGSGPQAGVSSLLAGFGGGDGDGGGGGGGGEDWAEEDEDDDNNLHGEHVVRKEAPKSFSATDYVSSFFNSLLRGDDEEARAEGIDREAKRTRVKHGKDGKEERVERKLVLREGLGLDEGLGVVAGEGIEKLPDDILLDVREASKFLGDEEKEAARQARLERQEKARNQTEHTGPTGFAAEKEAAPVTMTGMFSSLWNSTGLGSGSSPGAGPSNANSAVSPPPPPLAAVGAAGSDSGDYTDDDDDDDDGVDDDGDYSYYSDEDA